MHIYLYKYISMWSDIFMDGCILNNDCRLLIIYISITKTVTDCNLNHTYYPYNSHERDLNEKRSS